MFLYTPFLLPERGRVVSDVYLYRHRFSSPLFLFSLISAILNSRMSRCSLSAFSRIFYMVFALSFCIVRCRSIFGDL